MSDKQKELKRLHDIVFEGAPDWAEWVCKQALGGGTWYWLSNNKVKPDEHAFRYSEGYFCTKTKPCKNQPETFLDWTETLIKRGDYESCL